jgi:hypothetical protein
MSHSERKHALLSASGSKRWMNCTPSARLEDAQKKSKSSMYAQEGTLAHELSEIIIANTLDRLSDDDFETEFNRIKDNKFYKPEMLKYVNMYIDYILMNYTENSEIYVEERLDFSDYVPEGFGTGDIVLVEDDVLEMVDLKYGKGVKVDAHNNSQLRLYGLGALKLVELSHSIQIIKMTVVQPRLDSITTETMTKAELLNWGDHVKPKAQMAFKGLGNKVTGEWCRWCAVKHKCSEMAKFAVVAAKSDFKTPDLLNDDRLEELYASLHMIKS